MFLAIGGHNKKKMENWKKSKRAILEYHVNAQVFSCE